MNARKKCGLAGLALMLLGVTGTAWANLIYEFNSTAVGAFGPGPYGSVTLAQDGANVDVTVGLRADLDFVNTGGPHAVFSFNPTGVAVTDIRDVLFDGTANAAYSIQGPGENTPFGTFTFLLDCTTDNTGCTNGAGGAQADPLTFTVLNALEADLANLSTGGSPNAFFASDVICTSGSCNGSTGNIAAVAEPGTLALLGVGLLGFGAASARKRRT